jgi:hypothetical protein
MSDNEKGLPPKDYLQHLVGLDNLLIGGGQAVYLWADVLLSREIEEEMGPFTSKDLDIIGTSETILEIATATGWKYVFAPHKTATPVVGRLEGKSKDGGTLIVEVLRSIYGLSPEDIAKPVEIEYQGRSYKTLSPVTLLKAKLANCADLDQSKREDVRQTKVLIACVKEYIRIALKEVESGKSSERAAVNVLEALWRICSNGKNRGAAVRYELRLEDSFPQELETANSSKIENFCSFRLPKLKQDLQQDREEYAMRLDEPKPPEGRG